MDANFFVPFETAKLLREKGYPQAENDWYYEPAGEMLINEGVAELLRHKAGDNADRIVAAPTYHEVIDWLEGKEPTFGIDTFDGISPIDFSRRYYCKLYLGIEENGRRRSKYNMHFEGDTREAVLNAAIVKALEML